jgi:thiol:disulfide interchange protein DsbC
MLKQIIKNLTIITSVSLIACTNSQSNDQIKATLLKQFPQIKKIDSVTQSPIDALYQVNVGRQIVYMSKDGKYLVAGNIIDIANKQNLTQNEMEKSSVIDWNKLPLNLAIKEVIGNGARKIAVFSDPDCPYCKMFEQKVVPSLKNVTIYVFLFPLPIHPNAKRDSTNIWCSNDRSATWQSWMRKGTPLPVASAKCDTSGLETIYQIGADVVQVQGTPTIIFSNGTLLPGLLPADQFNAKLDSIASN